MMAIHFLKRVWKPFLLTISGYSLGVSLVLPQVAFFFGEPLADRLVWSLQLYPASVMVSAIYLLLLGVPALFASWMHAQRKMRTTSAARASLHGFILGSTILILTTTVLEVLAGDAVRLFSEPWLALAMGAFLGGGYGTTLYRIFWRYSGFALIGATESSQDPTPPHATA